MEDKEVEEKGDDLEEVDSYKIRKFKATDLPNDFRNLIIAPFKNSLRYGNDLFKLIDRDAYYEAYDKYIHILLGRPDSIITLAILDDETVLGWCLYERDVIHYVWVKKEVRRQGIGISLLPKTFNVISHVTNIGINIWVNKFPNVRLNPFV